VPALGMGCRARVAAASAGRRSGGETQGGTGAGFPARRASAFVAGSPGSVMGGEVGGQEAAAGPVGDGGDGSGAATELAGHLGDAAALHRAQPQDAAPAAGELVEGGPMRNASHPATSPPAEPGTRPGSGT